MALTNTGDVLGMGKWASWTPDWITGTDKRGATNSVNLNHRWTVVGGTLYANGGIDMASNSNFGYGDTWTLWFPVEWYYFVNTQTGGRIVGDGIAFGGTGRALNFTLVMVNTYDWLAVGQFVRSTKVGGGNFHNGLDETLPLSTSSLSWVANGSWCAIRYNFTFTKTV